MSETKLEERVIKPSKRPHKSSVKPSTASATSPSHEYMVKATDTRGRTMGVSVSVSPELRRLATVILHSAKFPFETDQDVWRWCMFYGLQELSDRAKDKEVTAARIMMENWIRASAVQMEFVYYESKLKKMQEVVEALQNNGHHEKALELAEMLWKGADALEDVYWCKYYRTKSYEIVQWVKEQEKVRRKEERKAGERE